MQNREVKPDLQTNPKANCTISIALFSVFLVATLGVETKTGRSASSTVNRYIGNLAVANIPSLFSMLIVPPSPASTKSFTLRSPRLEAEPGTILPVR